MSGSRNIRRGRLMLNSGVLTSPAATLAANAILRQRFFSSYASSSQLAPGVAYSHVTLAARSLLSVAYMVITSGRHRDFPRHGHEPWLPADGAWHQAQIRQIDECAHGLVEEHE